MEWWTAFWEGWQGFWSDSGNVKDVALPVAAIVVSSGAALGAVSVERRSAREERIADAISGVSSSHTAIAAACSMEDKVALTVAQYNFDSATTKLHLTLPKKNREVTLFFEMVIVNASRVQDWNTMISATGWLTGVLISWAAGRTSSQRMIRIARTEYRHLSSHDVEGWRKFTTQVAIPDENQGSGKGN